MRRERNPSEDRGESSWSCGTIKAVSYQELVVQRVLKVVCMVLQEEQTILYLKDLV